MTNADQPAFPSMDMNQHEGVDRLELRYEGLTKREFFAAMAMQGILASSPDKTHTTEVPEFAIILADELLRQLETTK